MFYTDHQVCTCWMAGHDALGSLYRLLPEKLGPQLLRAVQQCLVPGLGWAGPWAFSAAGWGTVTGAGLGGMRMGKHALHQDC